MNIGTLIDPLESASLLDPVSDAVRDRLGRALDGTAVGGALRGRWLGHPVHPILASTVVGAWTSAIALDMIDDESPAAPFLIGLGLLTAPPAIVTGWADWSTRGAAARRVGIVHAASNAVGVGLFAASYLRRRTVTDRTAKLLAVAGFAAVGIGGVLGGHLAYATED